MFPMIYDFVGECERTIPGFHYRGMSTGGLWMCVIGRRCEVRNFFFLFHIPFGSKNGARRLLVDRVVGALPFFCRKCFQLTGFFLSLPSKLYLELDFSQKKFRLISRLTGLSAGSYYFWTNLHKFRGYCPSGRMSSRVWYFESGRVFDGIFRGNISTVNSALKKWDARTASALDHIHIVTMPFFSSYQFCKNEGKMTVYAGAYWICTVD